MLEAAVGLKKIGYHVTVFLPSNGELAELLTEKEITFKVTPYPWWVHRETDKFGFRERLRSFFSVMKYSLRLYPGIRSINPDVVLSNTICNPCAALVCLFTRHKHIWFIHEFGKEDHRLLFNFGINFSGRFISMTSKKVLANAELVMAKYRKYINPSKLKLAHIDVATPAVDTQALAFNSSSFDLLVVGQMTEKKGQMDALLALKNLLKEGLDVRLILIGLVDDEVYHNKINDYINANALKESVVVLSHTNFPFKALTRFTIALMCSEFEALGRVTIEYMKAGLPVVGANASSTAKLIKDCETGLLYELRNPDDLADKVRILLNNEHLVQRLTAAAKSFADSHFNEANYIKDILEAINHD